MSEREFFVEMVWSCPACKADNRGHDLVCATCGRPKTSSDEDRMPSALLPVADPAKLAEAAAGPNWRCPYCQSEERDARGECARCGGERTAEPGAPARASRSVTIPPPPPPPPGDATFVERFLPDRFPVLSAMLATVVIGLLVAGAWWLFAPTERDVRVAGTHWTWTVVLRERHVLQGEGWRSGAPWGAYNLACVSRQRGTEDCHAHDCRCHSVSHSEPYDCDCHEACHEHCSSGHNGYARCRERCHLRCSTCYRPLPSTTECDTCYDQCPVYADWCSYTYEQWDVVNDATLRGTDHAPQRPALVAVDANHRTEDDLGFDVDFRGRDGAWSYRPANQTDYDRFTSGARWRVETNRAGMIRPEHVER